jgi:CheY-like chemotaxis protein
VVDDVESNRDLLKNVLGESGLTVYTAENGEEAIILAEEIRPVMIIMDIRMPVMDGGMAAKELKTRETTAHIPIMALTASINYMETVDKGEGLFDGYLAKPVIMEQLYAELCKTIPYEKTDKKSARVRERTENGLEPLKTIPGLKEAFASEILPLIGNTRGAFRMKAVREFAELLMQFGKRYHAEIILKQGEQMKAMAERFDMERIYQCMDDVRLMSEIILNDAPEQEPAQCVGKIA